MEAEALRRYPNPTADLFRAAAAKLHELTPDHLLAGNGSDDILTIVTRTFVPAGGAIAYPDPTYSLYPVLAQLQDARGIAVAWGTGTHLAGRGADRYRCSGDLPRQPERAHGHVRVAAGRVGAGPGLPRRGAGRRSLRRFRRRQLPPPRARAFERGDFALAEQGLLARGAAVRLRRRAAGGDCRDDEGERQLQLRCDRGHRRHGRHRGSGVRAVHLGSRPQRTAADRQGADAPRLDGAAQPGELLVRCRPPEDGGARLTRG